MKIDLEKFICSLMQFYDLRKYIGEALKDQGLEYKKGKIVEVELQKESKFDVGDWVVCIAAPKFTAFKIGDVVQISNKETLRLFWMFKDCFRKWTIQDAKDGDVLVASDDSIFIFKEVADNACKHYIALTIDNIVKENVGLEHFWETATSVKPATKEQREQLEKAMADAGYKWNAEELKLEKIEELSRFEKAVHDRIKDFDIEVCSNEEILEYSKVVAHELLELARKELKKEK